MPLLHAADVGRIPQAAIEAAHAVEEHLRVGGGANPAEPGRTLPARLPPPVGLRAVARPGEPPEFGSLGRNHEVLGFDLPRGREEGVLRGQDAVDSGQLADDAALEIRGGD